MQTQAKAWPGPGLLDLTSAYDLKLKGAVLFIQIAIPACPPPNWNHGAGIFNCGAPDLALNMALPEPLPASSAPLSSRWNKNQSVFQSGGFTLLEIATVMVILGILGTLTVPVVKGFRERAEGLKCMANLKGLGLGVQAYIVDHRCWPQIPNEKKGAGTSDAAPLSNSAQIFAEKWIATLAPYAIDEKTWRCPSVERKIKLQGTKEALDKKRIDYVPTSFDTNPDSPTQWPKHPWFIERGALHAAGPNLLFADGSISNVAELVKAMR